MQLHMVLIQQMRVLMYCISIYFFRFCILKIKEKKFFGLFINYTQKNKFYLRPNIHKTRISTFMF